MKKILNQVRKVGVVLKKLKLKLACQVGFGCDCITRSLALTLSLKNNVIMTLQLQGILYQNIAEVLMVPTVNS